jgi:ammonia channel protein AmtB
MASMVNFSNIVIIIFLVVVVVYTVSYGIWTWKKKNWFGAIMVFTLALVTIGLPIYSIYINA